MIFTRIGKIIAWGIVLLGIAAIAGGFMDINEGQSVAQRLQSLRIAGAGLMAIPLGVALGVLCEISGTLFRSTRAVREHEGKDDA